MHCCNTRRPYAAAAWYTAPLKALVTEKFFQLVREFGAKNVGLLTGDAAVNPTVRQLQQLEGPRVDPRLTPC